MNKIFGILMIGFLMIGCNHKSAENKAIEKKVEFNQELANELKKMAEIDQLAALNANPPEDYKHLSLDEWKSFKDSIFRTHQKRLKEVFDQYGFLGFDLVGKEGSLNFWLMTQHSDHNPKFQENVLEKMKIEVANSNASPSNYALLVDRVKLNTGQKQIYGTQVDYNWETCQAYPRNLTDSINVNKRRIEVGLEPIEEYLNRMSEMHFEMNKDLFLGKGIKKPKLYKENKASR